MLYIWYKVSYRTVPFLTGTGVFLNFCKHRLHSTYCKNNTKPSVFETKNLFRLFLWESEFESERAWIQPAIRAGILNARPAQLGSDLHSEIWMQTATFKTKLWKCEKRINLNNVELECTLKHFSKNWRIQMDPSSDDFRRKTCYPWKIRGGGLCKLDITYQYFSYQVFTNGHVFFNDLDNNEGT